MDKNSTSSLSNQQSSDKGDSDKGDSVENTKSRSNDGTFNDQGKQALEETPKNQGISNKLQDRTKHGGETNQSPLGGMPWQNSKRLHVNSVWRLPGKTPPVEV
jgi:hypothetical protein